ncbi:MAG: DEAD/DEAH box helicase [Alphaproteobacteria bacterium]|nr:DEAD/DEAH box helicase [Alphaproteobacteria bacterium]
MYCHRAACTEFTQVAVLAHVPPALSQQSVLARGLSNHIRDVWRGRNAASAQGRARKRTLKDFQSFGLAKPILDAVEAKRLTEPTPIQAQAIPPLLLGRDLVGLAQTGSGKTAAFVLPLLEKLARDPAPAPKGACRTLILAPTRELAGQCLEQVNLFSRGLNIRTALAIGGASIGRQKAETRRGLHILVATPGRLVDLVSQNAVSLGEVEYFVLDEVDQMLDLGFINAIRKIVSWLPASRQNVFFSATMSPSIGKLARGLLVDPVELRIANGSKPKIDESVIHLSAGEKTGRLIELASQSDFTSGLIFTRTKRGADRVSKSLNAAGLSSFPIHGNRSQGQRERALAAFKTGRARILVATDIAARGIDVTGVSHVVNYDLPNVPETYVHRIGRTGRAGASGVAVSFCVADERPFLRAIERLTKSPIKAIGADVANDDRASPHAADRRLPSRNKQGSNRSSNALAGTKAADEAKQKGKAKDGERGTSGVRRRRNRGAPGRKLQGAA